MNELIVNRQNIIFDIGNVLLAFDRPHLLMQLAEEEKHSAYMRYVFNGPEWQLLDKGDLDIFHAARLICAHPEMRGEFDRVVCLLQRFPEHMVAFGTSDFFPALKQSGKKLYYLSNFHAAAFQYVTAHHSFFRLFDGGVVSSAEHLLKPDERIYRVLLQRYCLDPHQCVFIDDTEENVRAAEALGIKGIVFNGLQSVVA